MDRRGGRSSQDERSDEQPKRGNAGSGRGHAAGIFVLTEIEEHGNCERAARVQRRGGWTTHSIGAIMTAIVSVSGAIMRLMPASTQPDVTDAVVEPEADEVRTGEAATGSMSGGSAC